MSIQEIAVSTGIEIPTLRSFAEVLSLSPNKLYVASRKPIAGAVYDPDAINWVALEGIFADCMEDENCAVHTLNELFDAAVAKQDELQAQSRRTTGTPKGQRKSTKMEMGHEDESLLCFKGDALVYKMVYQTAVSTCMQPVDAEGNFTSDEVKVLSNNTMNTKMVSPFSLAEGIAKRFSGEYQGAVVADTTAGVTEG